MNLNVCTANRNLNFRSIIKNKSKTKINAIRFKSVREITRNLEKINWQLARNWIILFKSRLDQSTAVTQSDHHYERSPTGNESCSV